MIGVPDDRAVADELHRVPRTRGTPTWGRSLLAATESCLVQSTEPERAREMALQAVREEPKNPDGQFCNPWGQLLAVTRDTSSAGGVVRAMQAWEPWDSNGWLMEAARPGDASTALAYARRAYVLSPLDTNVADLLAEKLLSTGEREETRNIAAALAVERRKYPVHLVESDFLLFVRIEASQAHFGAALTRARRAAEITPEDAGWVRVQRLEIAWRAVEVAEILGRAAEVADLVVERFVDPEPPPFDGEHLTVPMHIPAICALASRPVSRRCFSRFRALRLVGNAIAFVGSEPGRPAELWLMASPSAKPRRLTDLNAEIASRDLGKVESFTWQGPDRWQEDGVVTLPPGFSPGSKVPLVLYIHGGPQAASTLAFSAPAQLFAAQGWAVFSPNYRGSDNLGNAYQRAIVNDAGDGPGRDVLAGVDALVKRGFVDPARIAVSGWSYGGYMTSWLIGHDTRWKAAVAGAAVTDLADQYVFADFNVQMRYAMKGSATPFSPGGEALYRAQSPISYVTRAKTPTLILSDTGDFRVPYTQSFKLFRALKEAGVETSFVAIPVEGHFPGDPVRTREVFRRWVAWLEPRLK